MGRNKIELDYRIIDTALFFQASSTQVAYLLEQQGIKINPVWLRQRIKEDKDMTFDEYRQVHKDRLKYRLQQKAISMGLDGDKTLLIFCLKNIVGWQDRVENTNIDTTPIQIEIVQSEKED